MSQEKTVEIVDVNENNVTDVGFFCLMSRKKSEGYQRKLRWLKTRFAEGMRIKLLKLPERGFIEYIPGEYAWRAVNAKSYMFIHCLWVVGRSKGNGFATLLLNECIKDAKKAGMAGVAMATSEGNWLMGKRLLLQNGFKSVEQAPPSFELLVKKFRDAPSPRFLNNLEQRMGNCGKGFTIFRSDQCPYLEDATRMFVETAKEFNLNCKVIDLKSCQEVRKMSPSAYGVFDVVYDGKPFSYHYLLKKDIIKQLKAQYDYSLRQKEVKNV